MKKSIRKPVNWQDFESLCKKLWGEMWQIPIKIKKNGRSGQSQSGVDIYGKPKGEQHYFGIQCKGKDDYTDAKLTIAEIDREIKLAKNFKPQLGEFIFATSSNKDVRIEEYIREQNIKSIEAGGFSIDLFCWEDIEDLLEEYPNILNWYLCGLSSRTEYDITVFFEPKILKPNFIKEVTKYKKKEEEIIPEQFKYIAEAVSKFSYLKNIHSDILKPNTHINRSFVTIKIYLKNTGLKVIEHSQVRIKFTKGVRKLSNKKYLNVFEELDTPLVQKDFDIIKIDMLIEHNTSEIEFELELIARDFSTKNNYVIPVDQVLTEKINCIEVTEDVQVIDDVVEIKDNIESFYNSIPGLY
ncbi:MULTISPECIES: hypothetical protein [unclassified Myroides]|uniref:hypothetical protein n=1 Tax=unclassified Myroides TaxID=2642485 RepID=UPI003D2F9115